MDDGKLVLWWLAIFGLPLLLVLAAMAEYWWAETFSGPEETGESEEADES